MGRALGPGCAYVKDSGADRPSHIKRSWHVYHKGKNGAKEMRVPKPEAAQTRTVDEDGNPLQDNIDRLRLHSVVGFRVDCKEELRSTEDEVGISNHCFLRKQRQIYGRPVYETDLGDQVLYWIREGGSLSDAEEEEDTRGHEGELVAAGQTVNVQELFAWGHWIIAARLGEDKDEAIAFIRDNALTPDRISDKDWRLNDRSCSGRVKFVPEQSAVDTMTTDQFGAEGEPPSGSSSSSSDSD